MQNLRQTAVAWLLGVSGRVVRDMPDCPRNPDGTYNAQRVVAWYRERGGKAPVIVDDDPLLAGNSSPALERYRLARAIAAERENAVSTGQLVPIDDFEAWWGAEIAGPVRRLLETLGARYGQDCADLVERVFERAEQAIENRTIVDDGG